MGTFKSFRQAYGVLKDSTKVGLAKVNSDFKDLDIAIVKATNHVERPPKERHVKKILAATSAARPRADVAYCIHALAKRLSKTKNWNVAIKVLIVIHRTLREGDPTFREELANFSHRAHILQISNFKDDSTPLAWDCSAWVRAYALFLEERLECFRVLKYDIETERLTKSSPSSHSRTRLSGSDELIEQLPVLQQLLFRLVGCQPEGTAYSNYLVQYALALILKESFKVYCAINDGIINLVDKFFDMPKHDAIKALNIYKRAGQQAENLADFYEYCKGLDLARNFQFPTLRQTPPSFLATMEEYIKEAPQIRSVQNRLEYERREQSPPPSPPPPPPPPEDQVVETKAEETEMEEENKALADEEETQAKEEFEPLVPIDDMTRGLLGLNEINPRALEIEESNALALAIVPAGNGSTPNPGLSEIGGTGWELALVTTPSNYSTPPTESKLAGGFDKLLLDSLYEDDAARKQIQYKNAGYRVEDMNNVQQNPFQQYQHDPFIMSSLFPFLPSAPFLRVDSLDKGNSGVAMGGGDSQIFPGSRYRPSLKRPIWIIFLVSLVSLFLASSYIYPPHNSTACYIFFSRGCKPLTNRPPPSPARELTDKEFASRIVFRDILNIPPVQSKSSKIAFLFLTPRSLPFEKLWDMFFCGHEGKFSVYVHASKEKPVHASRYFLNREIHSDEVRWGKISMVDAERRLLAHALKDPNNQHFVLLSESCIPLHDFDHVYNYLIHANMSFVDWYSEHMLPEVEKKDFRKGAQWFSIKRQHALVVMADNLYYSRFRDYCKPGFDGKNCIADEHYLPTFFHMIDPGGIANWSVTHVDWSERKWHPKSYGAQDVTIELLKNITSIDLSVHVTSDVKSEEQVQACVWNGIRRPCYLFARKFNPETLDKLMMLLKF
ncbi:hypothetical protein V6N11_083544 [Hibiscus sabdariffa]|uniref:ENTH domain-containing protein n=1 Tax=Hibiscus sabdariffa TaxID=183260 RepID=A0ABR2ABQ9_9ROSI